MRIKLPETSAVYCTVGEERVWVQTLNTREMAEAQNYAQMESARYVAKMRAETAETIAAELAGVDDAMIGTILSAPYARQWETGCIDAYPYPVEPELVDLSEPGNVEKNLAIMTAYDQECAGIEGKRRALKQTRTEGVLAQWKSLPKEQQVQELVQASLAAKMTSMFELFFTEALLYHACRTADNHATHVFDDPAEVGTIPDDIRDLLLDGYSKADGVTSEAIPI